MTTHAQDVNVLFTFQRFLREPALNHQGLLKPGLEVAISTMREAGFEAHTVHLKLALHAPESDHHFPLRTTLRW